MLNVCAKFEIRILPRYELTTTRKVTQVG